MLGEQDRKFVDDLWLDALRPYVGGGIVPFYRTPAGAVDAARTIDAFMRMHNVCKLDPKTGREIPWPPIEGVVK